MHKAIDSPHFKRGKADTAIRGLVPKDFIEDFIYEDINLIRMAKRLVKKRIKTNSLTDGWLVQL